MKTYALVHAQTGVEQQADRRAMTREAVVSENEAFVRCGYPFAWVDAKRMVDGRRVKPPTC